MIRGTPGRKSRYITGRVKNKGGWRVKVSQFTKRELFHFQAFCNFTPDEETLFHLRSKGKTLEECAEEMNVSESTAKRIQNRVSRKIETEQKHMILS